MFFFFFKQKTAYEIVSRDWSSDVCSSDLIPKCLFWWVESISGTFGEIGLGLKKIFLGSNFHKVVDLTVLSTFMQVLPRSEWKTHFYLSDLVDSSTKVLVLLSRFHFWIIWRDWVKIGENFFLGSKFSQSCRSHRSEHFYASFTPIWMKNPLPLVRSGWFKYQRACFDE